MRWSPLHIIALPFVWMNITCNSYYMVVHGLRVIQREGRGREAQCAVLRLRDPDPSAVLLVKHENNHVITNLLYSCMGQELATAGCVALSLRAAKSRHLL